MSETLTKEEAMKKLGYTGDSVNNVKVNMADVLQQTIDQTVLVTTHNVVDQMISYILHRKDYEENKAILSEIIAALKMVEKRYEDRLNGEDNSSINSDNS